MSDRIAIDDLELWTRIGVTAAERAAEQRLLVSVEVETDTRAAAAADDLRRSVNYAEVAKGLRKLADGERRTIERLAEDAARVVLRTYRPASVTVTVTKFALPGARSVRVRITREHRRAAKATRR